MNRVKLVATDGMIYTNGEVYGRMVFLSTGDSPDNWYEITEAEYQAIMESETNDEETATEADYQASLREMGVMV